MNVAISQNLGQNREIGQKSVKESEIDKKLSVQFCLKSKIKVSYASLELSRIAPLDARAIFPGLAKKRAKNRHKSAKIWHKGRDFEKKFNT